ncbi:ABC transporter permease [Brevundimonas sp. 2R-24]|uniref:ABC transporter permease n=1 Tax=Peiella sedimenti TaxID=3061083 RepID=A0ABT8SN65_9CAUL|nr:ABC transporter permease [Caulobacteraceae bacterium XZ-24]
MRRTFLIARREYMAYARTVGFWLSLLALPLFGVLGAFIPVLMERAEPTREVVIVDLTAAPQDGLVAPGVAIVQEIARADRQAEIDALARAARGAAGLQAADQVRAVAERDGLEAGRAELTRAAPVAAQGFTPPRPSLVVRGTPPELARAQDVAAAEAAARPLLSGENPRFDGVVLLTGEAAEPQARVWAAKADDRTIQNRVREALREQRRTNALIAAGVQPETLRRLESERPEVQMFSPNARSGGEVSMADRMPGLVGFLLGLILWSAVVTGASILLNSVMEEKANRVLEILLSSASPAEVLTGKVLGVAAITLTVLVVWGGFAAAGLGFAGQALPSVAQGFQAALGGLLEGGAVFWLIAYFIGGYLMYAVIFAAIGAFCETPRDAQSLVGPIMMILIVPIFTMQMAVRNPDLMAVKALSWVPFFTPFLMTARINSQPPLIELVGTLAVMVAMVVLMIWLAGKAFRAGALSTAKADWKTLLRLGRA